MKNAFARNPVRQAILLSVGHAGVMHVIATEWRALISCGSQEMALVLAYIKGLIRSYQMVVNQSGITRDIKCGELCFHYQGELNVIKQVCAASLCRNVQLM